jgi:nicotinic acid mononucleotide adenylyltransferase
MHLGLLDIAAKSLRDHFAVDSLVGFVSPSSDIYVGRKLGADTIPFLDRYRMCVLSCQAHNAVEEFHIECDPWEGMQPSFVRFPNVRDRLQQVIGSEFPGEGLLVLYVCGADNFMNCSLWNWNNCAVVNRVNWDIGTTSDPARGLFVCRICDERYAAVFSDASSTEVRRRIANREPLFGLVYPAVAAYLERIRYRPSGIERKKR